MQYPHLSAPRLTRMIRAAFGGYDRSPDAPPESLYDMENLSGSAYPALSPRPPRGTYLTPRRLRGLCAVSTPEGEALCYVEGESGELVIGGVRYPLGLSDSEKRLIPLGDRLVILPDRKLFHIGEGRAEALDVSVTVTAPAADGTDPADTSAVTYTLCRPDGTPYLPLIPAAAPPASPAIGSYWLDTASATPALYRFTAEREAWEEVRDTCVRVTARGIGVPFRVGDGVRLEGVTPADARSLAGTHRLLGRGEDHLILRGILRGTTRQRAPLTVSRRLPPLDDAIAVGNRLWGFFHGVGEDGVCRSLIRACRAGDVFNWDVLPEDAGEADAPYLCEVGAGGPFTALAVYRGAPYFFKEGAAFRAEGTTAKNFRIRREDLPGVASGCRESVCVAGGKLIYRAPDALCLYDGSRVTDLSAPLGGQILRRVAAGALGDRVYLSLTDGEGAHHLFVYDVARGHFHREDGTRASRFCACGGELYFHDNPSGAIRTVNGSGTADGDPISWMAQTALFAAPDLRPLSPIRLDARLHLPLGASLHVDIQYDSDGRWHYLRSLHGHLLGSASLPIPPRSCDHFRLRFRGVGNARLYRLCAVVREREE